MFEKAAEIQVAFNQQERFYFFEIYTYSHTHAGMFISEFSKRKKIIYFQPPIAKILSI